MPKANVGQVQAMPDFLESKEVHILLTLWSVVRSYCMQVGIAGRSI
jgi:hypothetical protein